MGWMASWVAVQGAAKAELFEALGLTETGREAALGSRKWPYCFGELANGWLVVVANDPDWADPKRVAELSRLGRAVGLQFEDKVEMLATACAAADGVELWRVHHHNDPIWRLDVTGEPPPQLAEIRERCFREQEEDGGEESEVDFIHEIPIELAKAACGFRADDSEDVFWALERARPRKEAGTPRDVRSGGFLARLFGRK